MSSTTPALDTSEIIYLDINFGRATRIWWASAWRASLLGAGAALVIALLGAFIGALLGLHWLEQPTTTIPNAFFIVGAPAQIYAFRVALKKQYRHFTIRLVASPH